MNYRPNKGLALAVSAAIASGTIVSAEMSSAQAATVTTRVASQDFTSQNAETQGRQILEALYFGIGPRTQDALKQLDGTGYEEVVQAAGDPKGRTALRKMATLVERSGKLDMKTFGEDMTSGDPFRVENAVNDANEKVRAVVEAAAKTHQVPSGPTGNFTCVAIAQVAISAAYVVEYGVLVNAAAAVYAIAWYKGNHWVKFAPDNDSSLSKEEFFAKVTAAFQA